MASEECSKKDNGNGNGGKPGTSKGAVKAQVKPFTKESLDRLESKTVQLVRDYGFQPRRKLSVEDGAVLPGKFEPFPSKLYGKPLEEIDNFIYDETFCVVSKRFKKNYIHRFTATNSYFIFSPWNPIRRTCIFVSTNQYFDYVVMATILMNCVFLAMTETVEEAEYIFLGIYSIEMIIKSVAKGFILNKYTYLRNPWNWLDFVVITSGYVTIGMEIGNLAGLRTFRVLRALKTVSIMPGLKTIINALLHSFRQLAEVMTLTIFCLMVFALFALQVYMGELRNKCVKIVQYTNGSNLEWYQWVWDEENWLLNEEQEPVICGNATGARHCPVGYFCVQVGNNPNHGYTSFDNFLWSMLTTFQLITLDYWENVYNMVLASSGPTSVVFFTVVVFFGSFYLINLMLAVVALSYEEEAEITQEERRKDLTDHRDDSTFSFDPSKIKVKQLDKNRRRKIDSRKGVLLASYSRKKTRRRKRPRSTGGNGTSEAGNGHQGSRSRSATPSPRHSNTPRPEIRPQTLVLTPAVELRERSSVDTLHPANTLGPPRRGTLLSSNNTSENRESSLDDSGVVDDHEEDVTSEDVAQIPNVVQRPEPVAVSLSPREIRIIKCNGVSPSKKHMYTLPPDYLSHIVVIDDLPDRNCAKCTQCCVDYDGWLRFQSGLYKVVRDPLFDLVITLCIVLNTLFLAMEHHGMSESFRQALDIGNKVFTSIFTLECFLKLLALSKEFFNCGWNIFDLIVVSGSLLDLSFELVDGLSVLRGLRLLRVLKLAQSWTTMKVLLSIIISTIGALGNLTFVLVIVIYIFAVIGMQLFSKDYTENKFYPDTVPRWNFNDFFHSFMMIFRILCGEWIEPLWDCMRAEAESPEACFFIFLPALVMGNFMVLNLFLALLLNSFNSEELKSKKEPEEDDEETAEYKALLRHHVMVVTNLWRRFCGHKAQKQLPQPQQPLFYRRSIPSTSYSSSTRTKFVPVVQESLELYSEEVGETKLAKSFERIRSIVRKTRNVREKTDNEQNMKLEQMVREVMSRHEAEKKEMIKKRIEEKKYSVSVHEALNKKAEEKEKRYSLVEQPSHHALVRQEAVAVDSPQTKRQEKVIENKNILTTQQADSKDESNTESIEMEVVEKGPGEMETMLPSKNSEKKEVPKQPWHTLVSYVDELTVGGRKNSQGQYVDGLGNFPGFGRNKPAKIPQDCFPARCYEKSSCWIKCAETTFGKKFLKIRTGVLSVVDTQIFEWFILVLIFSSSITLCFEDIYLDENIPLKTVLYWTNLAFCLIFCVEMLLKWVALGFWNYFTSFWTLLDFFIVSVSLFSLLIEENENLKVLRSLRTLRALRPLRAISRWQGMRIVVNALMYAIPSIFNVLLVCLVFWLIFSIMGVQFFGGKFFKCVDSAGELILLDEVENMNECFEKNYTWINSKITFDNVGNAYLALFQVATFEGWMEVMSDAVDARGVNLQPQREANLYAYLYFVIFIVCGSFFTLNLFIGVIIDNFNMLKKKYEGGVLEMFLTESQKHYYTAMKKLGRKKPQKVIKRPVNQFLAMFYDLSNSRRFEIAIFVLIFLNMLSMGIEHFGQPHAIFFILEVSNAFFTTVFGLEALVKIVGLRYHYFTVPWNMFDFLLVLASILGILMEDIMIDFPISPTLLRVVRVFRIGRILRLIKAAKGIRKLLFALVVSLPALFNIGALLALITFIYAIIGMSVFGHVKHQGALDDMVNFETFGRSMQLLFRLMTSAGWNDVLESLMIQPPNCDPRYKNQLNGNCGSPLLAITYFTSFIIISYMIVINMYIAIILENFNQAHQEEEIGIVEDDLEMFYIRWSKFDPHASQFIRFAQLSDFIASLDPPLGIQKPNMVALVSFNLPIAKGNRIHCLDILHALVKYVLGHVEESDDFKKLQDQMDIKFKKQFPTRKELEIVSSTRMWKRQDKAARIIQKSFREYLRLKREKEREQMDLEDEMTQTSSPGGWQSRLSAFLHVHRGSRASSRKSSRASDASDVSELAGPWLNLPLLFLTPGFPDAQTTVAGNGKVSITVSEASPDVTDHSDQHLGKELVRPKDVSIFVTQPSPDATTPSTGTVSSQPLSPQSVIECQEEQPPPQPTTPSIGLEVHPLKLTPGGGVLSPYPIDVQDCDTPNLKRPSSESTGHIDRHPVLFRPGSTLSLCRTPPPVPQRRKKPTIAPPPPPVPERRLQKRPAVTSPPTPIGRRRGSSRRLKDSTLVHVLVHRESEESAEDKDS